ncbi:oxidoreductase [Babesia caballi]|uniref:Oxidoreductase n=1 Tax=Babesia caballi TaxID=5871 RepID=A0AAV4LPK8_BABCB|nr:oxidoreductase [Babesia caballi]
MHHLAELRLEVLYAVGHSQALAFHAVELGGGRFDRCGQGAKLVLQLALGVRKQAHLLAELRGFGLDFLQGRFQGSEFGLDGAHLVHGRDDSQRFAGFVHVHFKQVNAALQSVDGVRLLALCFFLSSRALTQLRELQLQQVGLEHAALGVKRGPLFAGAALNVERLQPALDLGELGFHGAVRHVVVLQELRGLLHLAVEGAVADHVAEGRQTLLGAEAAYLADGALLHDEVQVVAIGGVLLAEVDQVHALDQLPVVLPRHLAAVGHVQVLGSGEDALQAQLLLAVEDGMQAHVARDVEYDLHVRREVVVLRRLGAAVEVAAAVGVLQGLGQREADCQQHVALPRAIQADWTGVRRQRGSNTYR